VFGGLKLQALSLWLNVKAPGTVQFGFFREIFVFILIHFLPNLLFYLAKIKKVTAFYEQT